MLHPARELCATCVATVERNARLAHTLRKTIATLHEIHRMPGEPLEWSRCGHPQCQAAWKVLEGDRPQPLAPTLRRPMGANIGHGHVTPRADGVKARCGGPSMCSECAREQAAARVAR